jgi:hypothetical protein|tara:strand:+ start:401 stop:661 length:261 start_codon:yes stop_codon:yes gene_type:complete
MKLLIKETGLIAFKFKDTDTVAIDEYKLTVTETDKDGTSQSWESSSHNNSMFTIIEDVTAEMYQLGTQDQADHYSYQTYESNLKRR